MATHVVDFRQLWSVQDAEMGERLQVYDEVVLECTAPWFQAPQALILPHNGRTFEVKASPRVHLP